ncbi:PRC-barrel domain-containing protein [Nocardia sp. PE-7]|uniref:PRC-barrel domain-containing protein n=1 Tax=Nocardia sp. PE-7 TaxID=3058426 RepID=UPI00265A1096|nr:PRC-barrel domain-containing protein [Nocardia sp. PE-7]WKG09796.1 PRC-barrel domain-containing protein [Nocardia sp. PE-7]
MNEATLESLIGATVYDDHGDKIGKVKQIYLDNNSGSPTWAAVSTGLFSHDSLVPLAGAEHQADDSLKLHVAKEQVKSAPHLDEGGRISAQSEQELFEHYHVDPRTAGWNTYGRREIHPGDETPMTHGDSREAP